VLPPFPFTCPCLNLPCASSPKALSFDSVIPFLPEQTCAFDERGDGGGKAGGHSRSWERPGSFQNPSLVRRAPGQISREMHMHARAGAHARTRARVRARAHTHTHTHTHTHARAHGSSTRLPDLAQITTTAQTCSYDPSWTPLEIQGSTSQHCRTPVTMPDTIFILDN
jgi:hypothetical protein